MLASRGVLVDIRNPIVLVTGHTSRNMNQPLRRRRGSLRGGLGDRRRDPSFSIQDGRRRRWMGRSGLKGATRVATLYMRVPTTELIIRFVYCCTQETTEFRCTVQSNSSLFRWATHCHLPVPVSALARCVPHLLAIRDSRVTIGARVRAISVTVSLGHWQGGRGIRAVAGM